MPGLTPRLFGLLAASFLLFALPVQARDLSMQQTRVEIALREMENSKAEFDAATQQEARSRKALEQQKKQLEQDQKKTGLARKKYQAAKSRYQQAQAAMDQAWKTH